MAFVIPFIIAAADAAGSAAAGAAASVGIGTAAEGAIDTGLIAGSAGTTAGTTAAAAGTGAAATGMSTTTALSLGTTAASGAVGGYGAVKQGEAQAAAAKFNAGVESQNAAISSQNAQIAEQSGEAQAGIQGQKTKQAIGASIAGEGASGVDVSSGSFTNVQSSERQLGEIDAMTIKSNAAREAYGYKVKSASEQGQSAVSAFEAANDTKGGKIAGASTFLGSLGSADTAYQKYKISSGFTG